MDTLDLDTIIDRRGTGCLKYDFAVQRGKPADVLPFWVADMDFRVAEPITRALHAHVDHGIFGYSEAGSSYFKALADWQKTYFHWTIHPEWLIKTPGVVPAINIAVKALTKPGGRRTAPPACLLSLPLRHRKEWPPPRKQRSRPERGTL